MGLSDLTQGKKFKQFMARLYGWGASIVIIGALFKIQHWPFSGFFLVLGLGTEAVIFFFSALSRHMKMLIGPSYILNLPEWMMIHTAKKKRKRKSILLHSILIN